MRIHRYFLFQSELADSPQDLSSGALLDKESYNEDDSKSEEPSSPPSTPQSLASASNRPPPPLIPFSPKSNVTGKDPILMLGYS